MPTIQIVKRLRADLPLEDESGKELSRVLSFEAGALRNKGLQAWLIQYQKEVSKKPFLMPLAHALVLWMADNNIPRAFHLLTGHDLTETLNNNKVRLAPVEMGFAIKSYIKVMPRRYGKGGFTSDPFSPLNTLCVQLAYLCLDWSKPDVQRELWSILYPEIISVYDGNDNSVWPSYGHAILCKNMRGEFQTRLVNYAEVFKHASKDLTSERLRQELTLINLHRVFQFVPLHQHFWIRYQNQNLPETSDKNYFEFFTRLQNFLYKHRYHYQATPDPLTGEISTDLEISPSAQAEFWTKYAPFLRGFQHYLNTEPESNRRKIDAILTCEDKRLLRLMETLLNPSQDEGNMDSCFERNQRDLKVLLSDTDRCEFLKTIPIHTDFIPTDRDFLFGQDRLTDSVNSRKGYKDKNQLLDAMNDTFSEHDIRPHAHFWGEEYKRIGGGQAYKARYLHDFIYQIKSQEQRLTILYNVLGSPLDFSLLLPDRPDQYYQYARKIIDSNPELYEADPEVLNRIDWGLNRAFEANELRIPITELVKLNNNPNFTVEKILNQEMPSRVSDNFNFYVFMRITSPKISREQFSQLVSYYSEDLNVYFASMPGSFFDYFAKLSHERKTLLINRIRLSVSVCSEYRDPTDAFLSFLLFSENLTQDEKIQIQKTWFTLLDQNKSNLGRTFYSKELLRRLFENVTYPPLKKYLFDFYKNRLIDTIVLTRSDFNCYQALFPEYDLLNIFIERYKSNADCFLPRFVYELLHERKLDNLKFLSDLWDTDNSRLDYFTLFLEPMILRPFLNHLMKLCELSFKIDYLLGNIGAEFDANKSLKMHESCTLGLHLTVANYINRMRANISSEALQLARIPDETERRAKVYERVMEKRCSVKKPLIFLFYPPIHQEDPLLRENVRKLASNPLN